MALSTNSGVDRGAISKLNNIFQESQREASAIATEVQRNEDNAIKIQQLHDYINSRQQEVVYDDVFE